ncbi:peptidoglycan-binding protein [Candidatus Parcubacteria bacterium]|nr:peptidoglycan-binding protein [Candidatus Parcubacteria bacterium]
MRGGEVFCLQQFLKSQGPEIYPEGLVTGYFGPLTLSAVKRFQQKYWKEILAPWGLNQNQPTGIVGPTTRAKINQILSSLGT